MNINKVKGKMVELQISGKEMADEMGIDPSTFYRKLKDDGKNFNCGELMVFKRVLHLNNEEALDFLLSENSQKREKGA